MSSSLRWPGLCRPHCALSLRALSLALASPALMKPLRKPFQITLPHSQGCMPPVLNSTGCFDFQKRMQLPTHDLAKAAASCHTSKLQWFTRLREAYMSLTPLTVNQSTAAWYQFVQFEPLINCTSKLGSWLATAAPSDPILNIAIPWRRQPITDSCNCWPPLLKGCINIGILCPLHSSSFPAGSGDWEL